MERVLKRWGTAGGGVATFLFFLRMVRRHLPVGLLRLLNRWSEKVNIFFNPYVQISIHEYIKRNMTPHTAYAAVEAYLGAMSVKEASRLKAEMVNNDATPDGKPLLALSMDEHERIDDEFRGAEVQWVACKLQPRLSKDSYPEVENRSYKLIFHKKYRDLMADSYLNHVVRKGKEILGRYKPLKLYTNNVSGKALWSHVVFDHPASFEKLAMDAGKKKEILDDLIAFKEGRDYYAKIGKAWKRGYLLYGPPGTGKSTMIAAMANFLNYDIYDLELTSVSDNTKLRELLAETTSKSIVVIEDIDCSLDITESRNKSLEVNIEKTNEDSVLSRARGGRGPSKVTLSGLLNFIDGLWSTCSGERVIVFTTNHVEKLDPALTRRGRMDKHIELSYCTFEGFKVLARNYLELEDHPLFESIEVLMRETMITPVDVIENLMPKSCVDDRDRRLENLIQTLKQAKQHIKADQGKNEMEGN
ncbi:unnamed protein product [Cuscuta campestris]|uniref:AAA+ ATPase domain-containing protein n=1 Tax=Cuscuta campestris TaxID=132261 RepID=A0A484N321_9ASTE|nr:unnamed protein product [Cuscuta campestris]